jgi:hypothetical protein
MVKQRTGTLYLLYLLDLLYLLYVHPPRMVFAKSTETLEKKRIAGAR